MLHRLVRRPIILPAVSMVLGESAVMCAPLYSKLERLWTVGVVFGTSSLVLGLVRPRTWRGADPRS